jgi:23S rRNA (uracil1939-C5)-methyltransferase
MPSGDRIELDVTDLSYLGDGVGHVDSNFAVFASGGLPGERVVLDVDERRGTYLHGRVHLVLVGAPDRVTPPCRYFGECGGCQVQHLDYGAQVRWKTEMVRRQLNRIGQGVLPEVRPCIAAPEPWMYRNNARFSVDSRGQIGFLRPKSHVVLPIDDCLIMQPEIAAIMPRLQAVWPGAHQVVVRYGARTGQLLVAPRLPVTDTVLQSGQESYEEVLLGRAFRVSATSFFQVNTRVDRRTLPEGIDRRWISEFKLADQPAELDLDPLLSLSQVDILALLVLSHLELTGREYVVDAYCGVGTFACLIAERAGRVLGIDEVNLAILDAVHNARAHENLTFVHGQTEDHLARLDSKPDAVVLDPSRIGCHPRVLAALATLRPAMIVYVSCDLATLTRDVRRLIESGYELADIQPIDMFPQTHHIETVVALRLRHSATGMVSAIGPQFD